MGLMNAIGLQPRNPTTSVTSQGTQTLALQLQNAETQTEREEQEQGTAPTGPGEGRSRTAGGASAWGGYQEHPQPSWRGAGGCRLLDHCPLPAQAGYLGNAPTGGRRAELLSPGS